MGTISRQMEFLLYHIDENHSKSYIIKHHNINDFLATLPPQVHIFCYDVGLMLHYLVVVCSSKDIRFLLDSITLLLTGTEQQIITLCSCKG